VILGITVQNKSLGFIQTKPRAHAQMEYDLIAWLGTLWVCGASWREMMEFFIKTHDCLGGVRESAIGIADLYVVYLLCNSEGQKNQAQRN
jgi:hypothetical protein